MPATAEPLFREAWHDPRDLAYQVRVRTEGVIVDRATGEVVMRGDEEYVRGLYRALRRREP